MTKRDIDEIFSCQLFGWRFALFATALINFFIPHFWEVGSIIGAVNFSAWNWCKGLSILANGTEIYVRPASWAMMGSLAFVVLGGVAALVRTKKAAVMAAVFSCLALWLAWEQIGVAEKVAAAHSAPGVFQIAVGAAKTWILIPLALAAGTCGYAAFGANQKVMFGAQARDED